MLGLRFLYDALIPVLQYLVSPFHQPNSQNDKIQLKAHAKHPKYLLLILSLEEDSARLIGQPLIITNIIFYSAKIEIFYPPNFYSFTNINHCGGRRNPNPNSAISPIPQKLAKKKNVKINSHASPIKCIKKQVSLSPHNINNSHQICYLTFQIL